MEGGFKVGQQETFGNWLDTEQLKLAQGVDSVCVRNGHNKERSIRPVSRSVKILTRQIVPIGFNTRWMVREMVELEFRLDSVQEMLEHS